MPLYTSYQEKLMIDSSRKFYSTESTMRPGNTTKPQNSIYWEFSRWFESCKEKSDWVRYSYMSKDCSICAKNCTRSHHRRNKHRMRLVRKREQKGRTVALARQLQILYNFKKPRHRCFSKPLQQMLAKEVVLYLLWARSNANYSPRLSAFFTRRWIGWVKTRLVWCTR